MTPYVLSLHANTLPDNTEYVYKVEPLLFSVIPACPESLFKKDSRLASLAGMTNDCSLYTDSI